MGGVGTRRGYKEWSLGGVGVQERISQEEGALLSQHLFSCPLTLVRDLQRVYAYASPSRDEKLNSCVYKSFNTNKVSENVCKSYSGSVYSFVFKKEREGEERKRMKKKGRQKKKRGKEKTENREERGKEKENGKKKRNGRKRKGKKERRKRKKEERKRRKEVH